jgi:hypothetical protein
MWRRVLLQHGWKLFILPVFFDVPDWVRYVCAAIVVASLIVDVILWRRERRGGARSTA